MTFPPRRTLLLLAGMATIAVAVGLTVSVSSTPPKVPIATKVAATTAATSPSPRETISGTAAATEAPPRDVPDIFGTRTWEPPPPAAPPQAMVVEVAPPPPPPQAPPLPFRLLGTIVDPGHGMTFMLMRDTEMLAVKVGDTVGNTYRIDKFANGQLEIVYQPLSIRQILTVGSDL